MAGCVPQYVDDLQPAGASEEDTWQVSH
jgi:hypothetical protein